MIYSEMTESELAAYSESLAEEFGYADAAPAIAVAQRLNDGAFYTNHPSHSFTGIDGRCMDCDCRPYGRHAPHPCPVY